LERLCKPTLNTATLSTRMHWRQSQHKTPWITFRGHSRSHHILGSLKNRRGTAYYCIIMWALESEISKERFKTLSVRKWQLSLRRNYKSYPKSHGKERLKRKALRWPRKTDIEDADVTCWGRLFQVRAAATRKARLPTVDSWWKEATVVVFVGLANFPWSTVVGVTPALCAQYRLSRRSTNKSVEITDDRCSPPLQ